MNKIAEKTKNIIRQLPDKKRYLDFFTAVLTVPILLTVILTNISNMQNAKKTDPTPTPTPVYTEIPEPTISLKKEYPTSAIETSPRPIISASPSPAADQSPTQIPTLSQTACKKKVGPVAIERPIENQTVSTDPLCFDIQYEDQSYCPVTWSYRINGGSWSDFVDSDICLINAASGEKKFELKVRSAVSNDETTLIRTIIYKNPNETPTPTATPTTAATSSAALN